MNERLPQPKQFDTVPTPIRVVRAAAADVDGGTESHFLDYARVLYKRRWTVITGFMVAFGVMFTYSSSATPMYTARVQLLIENDSQNVMKFDEVYEPNKTTNDYYQTQYRLLQSRLIARRTIEAEKLWTHPALTGESAARRQRLSMASADRCNRGRCRRPARSRNSATRLRMPIRPLWSTHSSAR